MFKNIGNKIKITAIVLFVLTSITCAAPLVYGIVRNSVRLMIFGGVALVLGILVSLFVAYLIYGYGVLIKSNVEAVKTNEKILKFLENNVADLSVIAKKTLRQIEKNREERVEPKAVPKIEPIREETVVEDASPIDNIENQEAENAPSDKAVDEGVEVEAAPEVEPNCDSEPTEENKAVETADNESQNDDIASFANPPYQKYCINCGCGAIEEALFCKKCGSKLN